MDGRFKKGNKANEVGQLPIGQKIKEMRKLTRIEYERLAGKYLFMTIEDMEALAKRKDIQTIDYLIISSIIHGIKHGDFKVLEFHLDRLIGTPVRKYKFEVEEPNPNELAEPVPMTDAERVEMLDLMKARYLNKKESEVIDVEPSKPQSPNPRNDQSEVSETDED